MANRRISDKGIALLVEFEGEILHVYKDPVGLPTFGVGHLVTPAERDEFPVGKKIAKAVSREYLRRDVKRFEDAVNSLVMVPLTQNQFDALVSLVFNIGEGNFRKSSVLRHLNARNYSQAAASFMRFNKARKNGVLTVLSGLTRRRNAEIALFNKKDSAAVSTNVETEDTPGPAVLDPQVELPETTAQAADIKPSIWDRITGWTEKFTKVNALNDAVSPISSSSKFAVITTKAGGWALMLAGFFVDHWLWLAGIVLLVAAIWYLSHSKDRAQERSK